MDDLCALSAHDLLGLYRSKRCSPVEVCGALLARVDRLNPLLKAFVLVDHEAALASARASEVRWMRDSPMGPLDGVPVSIKDIILTRGWPTLRGSLGIDPAQVWDIDAPVSARLRESGAVLFGKTTTPEYGHKAETNSPGSVPVSLGGGATCNPWDLSKTTGGSSGGAAAAIAAGLGPLSVGTDGAGSVRIPAAFCGNVGMKPSFGRVPAYPLSPYGTVAHLGPHTMSVADAALMLDVMKQPDARDWTSLPPDSRSYLARLEAPARAHGLGVSDQPLAGLRAAYSPTLGYVRNLDPQVREALDRAVVLLEGLGLEIEACDPGIEDPLEISTGLWFLGSLSVWSGLSEEQKRVCDPDFTAQAQWGKQISGLQATQLHQRRGLLGSHMRQWMLPYDVLITPTVASTAFANRAPGSVPMSPETMLGWTPYSYPFNLTQQPALTIPCGLSNQGLPIGMQLVGRMFDDMTVLRVAAAFEECMPIPRPVL